MHYIRNEHEYNYSIIKRMCEHMHTYQFVANYFISILHNTRRRGVVYARYDLFLIAFLLFQNAFVIQQYKFIRNICVPVVVFKLAETRNDDCCNWKRHVYVIVYIYTCASQFSFFPRKKLLYKTKRNKTRRKYFLNTFEFGRFVRVPLWLRRVVYSAEHNYLTSLPADLCCVLIALVNYIDWSS